MRKKLFATLYVVLCMTLLFTLNVSAYIDPSVVSYIIQAVAGVVIASGAVVGIYWKKIRLFFKKKKEAKNNPPSVIKTETPESSVDTTE